MKIGSMYRKKYNKDFFQHGAYIPSHHTLTVWKTNNPNDWHEVDRIASIDLFLLVEIYDCGIRVSSYPNYFWAKVLTPKGLGWLEVLDSSPFVTHNEAFDSLFEEVTNLTIEQEATCLLLPNLK